jgi:hypothetical protein
VNTEIGLPEAIVNVRGGLGLSTSGAGDLGGRLSEIGLLVEPEADGLLAPAGGTRDASAVGDGDGSTRASEGSGVALGDGDGWVVAVSGDDEQPNWAAIIVANSRQQTREIFDRCCI